MSTNSDVNESISSSMTEICKEVLVKSNYRLIPLRMMNPENYTHPPKSMESKKALLLSLSPMLAEAEKQQKSDVAACQKFTGCSSNKGKGRHSSYEYRDLNSTIVEPEEYEIK